MADIRSSMPLSLHRLPDPVSAGLVPLIGLPYAIARFCLLRGKIPQGCGFVGN